MRREGGREGGGNGRGGGLKVRLSVQSRQWLRHAEQRTARMHVFAFINAGAFSRMAACV